MRKPNGKNGKRTGSRLSPRDPVPNFKNLEEEVEFWETHDLTEYRDYWREVKDVKINLDSRRLRLENDLAQKIGRIARQRGVSSETLMNLWLQQKLAETLKDEKRHSSRRQSTSSQPDLKRKAGLSQYA